MRALFLDFDGVLHPSSGPPGTSLPFEWTNKLAALLEPFDDVHIVVHSSWREQFPLEALRDFLEPIGHRVLGAVTSGPKGPAIERFLRDHPEITDALVLDDQESEVTAALPITIVVCDPRVGLSSVTTQLQVKTWLLESGTVEPRLPDVS